MFLHIFWLLIFEVANQCICIYHLSEETGNFLIRPDIPFCLFITNNGKQCHSRPLRLQDSVGEEHLLLGPHRELAEDKLPDPGVEVQGHSALGAGIPPGVDHVELFADLLPPHPGLGEGH